MKDYHPDLELAPRDVVSRAIVEQIRKTHFTHVFLDVRHLPTEQFRARFPQLAQLCDQFDINVAKDLIPIHPATHYMIGGVDADELGRTSLPGLYAVGEASCSGLHGANRLASNSLLEGLVFGARAGIDAAHEAKKNHVHFPQTLEHKVPASSKTELDVTDVKSSLRSVMWRNVGIEREGDRLAETREIIAFWSRYVMDKTFSPAEIGAVAAVAGWELQNMLTACFLITAAAYMRTESRGTHFRTDYPDRDDAHWRLAPALAPPDGNGDPGTGRVKVKVVLQGKYSPQRRRGRREDRGPRISRIDTNEMQIELLFIHVDSCDSWPKIS